MNKKSGIQVLQEDIIDTWLTSKLLPYAVNHIGGTFVFHTMKDPAL